MGIMHSCCRVTEWQGSSPLAWKGWNLHRISIVHSLHARGELHCDSHPELLHLIFFSLLLLHVHIIFLECSYVSLLAVLSLHGRYIYWHTAKLYDQNLDMPPNMPKQDNAREANCHF